MLNQSKIKLKAFTLAEVLITLVIIGVVAALTIPTVIKNYNDKKYNTARLKALKTFGEAGRLASINNEINGQPNAKDFVNKVLSKYLKITKVCDTASECNFPSQIQPSNPDAIKLNSSELVKWSQIGGSNTNIGSPNNNELMSTYITTADGYSAKVFYNPKCGRNNSDVSPVKPCPSQECWHYILDATCMNVVYDMNGVKSPNHAGYDIGVVTTFWSGLNAVSTAPGIPPFSINKGNVNTSYENALNRCARIGTSKILYSLPNIDEISSMVINRSITSFPGNYFWSGTPSRYSPNSVLTATYLSQRSVSAIGNGNNVVFGWCVRR